jgi:hypothetical protein
LPNSSDEWLAKAREHEAAARMCARKGAPEAARAMVMHHCGSAVEFALKAVIMKVERLNKWPGPKDPGHGAYWTHDLRKLKSKAKLKIAATDPVAPAWQVLVAWTRTADYTYSPKPTPLVVARSYVEAAFGPHGVVKWIESQLK